MRLLIVVPSLRRAGAETQAVDLANGLAARGHDVHLLSFEAEQDQRDRVSAGVSLHHRLRGSKFDWSVVKWLSDVIDRERIEVVQGVMQFGTLVGWLAARRSHRRPSVVAAIHTTVNLGLKEEIQDRVVYRWLLRTLPTVIFVCRNQRDYWTLRFPELRNCSRIVYNGVDPNRYDRRMLAGAGTALRKALGIGPEAFVFACIAGFRPEKGHELLLEAFSQLTGSPFLILAGDGVMRSAIQAKAAAMGLTTRIRFLGQVEDTRAAIVASNATVLASTSVETFSMAMLESMASAVPVIVPQIGGLPEAIIEGESGRLFPVGDVQALATCMQSLVADPASATRMGERAAHRLAREFTFDKMIDESERALSDAARVFPGNTGTPRRSRT